MYLPLGIIECRISNVEPRICLGHLPAEPLRERLNAKTQRRNDSELGDGEYVPKPFSMNVEARSPWAHIYSPSPAYLAPLRLCVFAFTRVHLWPESAPGARSFPAVFLRLWLLEKSQPLPEQRDQSVCLSGCSEWSCAAGQRPVLTLP